MKPLGQGLMGGGLAVLYVTLYAGFHWYGLFGQGAAFAMMAFVTAAGVSLAVLHDSLATAVIALLGGLLTPVLVSTGAGSRDALFGYTLVLNLGVLGAAAFRNWRALDAVAIAGTWILYGGWFSEHFTREEYAGALVWSSVFFLVFMALPLVYHARKRLELPMARVLMSAANAFIAFGFAWNILGPDRREALAFYCLAASAVYFAAGGAVRRRIVGDARALFTTVALSVFFLTLASRSDPRAEANRLRSGTRAPARRHTTSRATRNVCERRGLSARRSGPRKLSRPHPGQSHRGANATRGRCGPRCLRVRPSWRHWWFARRERPRRKNDRGRGAAGRERRGMRSHRNPRPLASPRLGRQTEPRRVRR